MIQLASLLSACSAYPFPPFPPPTTLRSSLLTFASILPSFLTICYRWDKRRTLITTDIITAITNLFLVLSFVYYGTQDAGNNVLHSDSTIGDIMSINKNDNNNDFEEMNDNNILEGMKGLLLLLFGNHSNNNSTSNSNTAAILWSIYLASEYHYIDRSYKLLFLYLLIIYSIFYVLFCIPRFYWFYIRCVSGNSIPGKINQIH